MSAKAKDWAIRENALPLQDGSNAPWLDSSWPACCGGEPMRRTGRRFAHNPMRIEYRCDACLCVEHVVQGRVSLRVAPVNDAVRALLSHLRSLPGR